ncbi:hypothetical protein AAFF_G00021650 [Aldrovandia affinis]|uniref:Reverse transcriptase domain-containing protein n=1 Tax=Aldrovandia affinis TaxID=143900 RepID=A0AAD7S511_9TELE|nr:hypothetical protein AAFF_G00021650 [Aldrovandia affinis]
MVWSVEDAILLMLYRMYSHLEKAGSSVRVVFFDFSSAFNTIQPHVLRTKLSNMKMHRPMVNWIHDYLLSRPVCPTERRHIGGGGPTEEKQCHYSSCGSTRPREGRGPRSLLWLLNYELHRTSESPAAWHETTGPHSLEMPIVAAGVREQPSLWYSLVPWGSLVNFSMC